MPVDPMRGRPANKAGAKSVPSGKRIVKPAVNGPTKESAMAAVKGPAKEVPPPAVAPATGSTGDARAHGGALHPERVWPD